MAAHSGEHSSRQDLRTFGLNARTILQQWLVWLQCICLLQLAHDCLLTQVNMRHSARLGMRAAVGSLLLVASIGLALGLSRLLDGLGHVAVLGDAVDLAQMLVSLLERLVVLKLASFTRRRLQSNTCETSMKG